jgi:hypothetical protein
LRRLGAAAGVLLMGVMCVGPGAGGAVAAAQEEEEPNPRVGFYQWEGVPPEGERRSVLEIARERVRESGAGLIRIHLGARYDYVYPRLDPRRFAGELEERTPLRIAQLPRYRAVIEDPSFPTVVLTVYPARDYGAGYDDTNLLRKWSRVEERTEYEQIRELCEWLLTSYGKLRKTVIIANSEADEKLLEMMNYTGSAELAVANLVAWQRARHGAVEAARKKAGGGGGTLELVSAFEVSLVNLKIARQGSGFVKSAQGQWNALHDVAPHVPFDLLSYSAYESTNGPYETQETGGPAGEIGKRLARDLAILRKQAQGRRVMIGELGFAREVFRWQAGGVTARWRAALAALTREKPAYVVFWQVLDSPPAAEAGQPSGWGLLVEKLPAPVREFIRSYERRVR